MPLPTVNLDDRHFQDIVDEAKGLIQRFCPEWTDHNVSDPGVALIELFAWMTDMLLYRVNQIPDNVYVRFLELIGLTLAPPRSARAPVTFYLSTSLSGPQQADLVIPRDTDVATMRTETTPAIIFTTEKDLIIRPAITGGAFTRNASRSGAEAWTTHDLTQLGLPNRKIVMFPKDPAKNDAFCIGLKNDHSMHVLALILDCEGAGGAGVDPTNPPLEWQVWQGGLARWVDCEVDHDGTGGFNWSGEIVLHLPDMARAPLDGMPNSPEMFWLRCRLTDPIIGPQGEPQFYKISPDLLRLQVESRGGTTYARHATNVRNEFLGTSTAEPGQQFQLLNTNLLARDHDRDYLIVEPPGAPEERWQEQPDFAESGEQDPHYTLDSLAGVITLGPALKQPDGKMYSFGKIPPKGSALRFSRYQHGGGRIGNMPAGAIAVLKTSIPYIREVTNRKEAIGGQDSQSLEDAKLRAPQYLRTRTRAMTADDYEYLAVAVPGVARACCIAPGAQPGGPNDPKPGQVAVLVVPQVDQPHGEIQADQMKLSADVRAAVIAELDKRRPLGIALEVGQPTYFRIVVNAKLRVRDQNNKVLIEDVRQRALADLYRYLNPYIGGPDGDGWPFGRDLHVSEIYGLLQRINGVEFVEQIQLSRIDPNSSAPPAAVGQRLALPRQGIICSGTHQVSFS
jgi:predicted phage baseplate assembly protein